ncbi:hypothetical protein MJ579_02465 [Klebsiella pneumoniae]|nr:hypothetical protein MJ579_02465 [Klebsiella pneumoniae]
MFKVTHMVMRCAPVGHLPDFGNRRHLRSLLAVAAGLLVLLVYFAILFFALVVLGIVARLCGLSI